MTAIIYIGYLIIGILILYWSRTKYQSLLSWQWMTAAFLLRIIIGTAYGYLYSHAKQDLSDTWKFFFDAKEQAYIFREHPLSFFTYDIIDHHIYSGSLVNDIFKQKHSFFNDQHDILFIRVVNFFNILSGERYYVNVLLFNMWMIWGSINFGKWLLRYLPNHKIVLLLFLFAFPSFLYWNSGVHRDGLAFWLFSTILYATQKLFSKKWSINSIFVSLCILIEILALFMFKIYWTILLIPFLSLLYIIEYKHIKKISIYFGVLTLIGILFFIASNKFPEAFRLSEKLAEKQHAFLTEVHGTIRLNLPFLNDSIISYFTIIPYAIRNLFFTPSFKDWFSPVGMFALFGQISLWLMLILAFIFPLKNWKLTLKQPVILFLFFFSACNLLLIGITIPYLSALIRYIVNFQTFILIILGCIIDWYRIFDLRIFKRNNMNKFVKK